MLAELIDELGLGGFQVGAGVRGLTEEAGHTHTGPRPEGALTLLLEDEDSRRVYLLKEKRAYLSEAEMRRHLAVHAHSLRNGGPVAALPPRLLDGAPLVTPTGRLFELQEWLRGPTLSGDDKRQLSEFGEVLARFHRSVRDFRWLEPGDGTLHREPRGRFEKTRFHTPLLRKALSDSGHAALLDAIFERLDEAERRKGRLEASLGPEPRQPVHGDPTPENVIVTEDGCYLIDLDDAHLAPRGEDVAWALTWCAAFQEEGGPHFYDEWRLDAVRAFLAGYQSAWPLPAESLRLLACWCVASVACVTTDGFFSDVTGLLVEVEAFAGECRKALRLIEQVNDLSFSELAEGA